MVTPPSLFETIRGVLRTSGGVAWGIACIVLLGASACRHAEAPPDASPSERALEQCHRRVARSVERARKLSEAQEAYVVDARLNPARCPSPSFEIFARGTWARVHLEASGDVQKALASFRRRAAGSSALERIRLEIEPTERRHTEQALDFPVFTVRRIVDR